MTTIAQRMPAAERAVCTFDSIDDLANSRAEPALSTSASDQSTFKAKRGQEQAVQSDYAWVEMAAMAGTHMPRG